MQRSPASKPAEKRREKLPWNGSDCVAHAEHIQISSSHLPSGGCSVYIFSLHFKLQGIPKILES
jgi:hypothetical protein